MENINPHQLRRFIKHLSSVSKKYYELEQARDNVKAHIEHVKGKQEALQIEEINEKLDHLMDKESQVASLGISKKAPASVINKIRILQNQLHSTRDERDDLLRENDMLRKSVDAFSKFKSTAQDINDYKETTEQRVAQLEKTMDKQYKKYLVGQVKQKIALLETNLTRLSSDKSISKAKLVNIRAKIRDYKKKIAKL